MLTDFLDDMNDWERGLVVLAAALAAHGLVLFVRWSNRKIMLRLGDAHISKARTVLGLVTSAAVFTLYFAAIGFGLSEFGISLTTYLAGASIIGLAVAFGSQGLVQDVVSGITAVFSNLFDIGDVVEIGGQTGIVIRFGMRFTVLRSPMSAYVSVPNRNIGNVILYPRGYVRCLVDVVLPADTDAAAKLSELARAQAEAAEEQFAGVFRGPPEVTGPYKTSAGKEYLRLKFRIWPGRGAPLEGPFCQELRQVIRGVVPDYADWMVAASYEVETYTPPKWRQV